MNPRFLQSETSLSMLTGIVIPRYSLSRPAAADDASGADLDSQRVALQFRHDRELVHLGGGGDVGIVAELRQVFPAAAEFKRREQYQALILEAIPCQPGRVVQLQLVMIAQGFDKRTRQERVLEA